MIVIIVAIISIINIVITISLFTLFLLSSSSVMFAPSAQLCVPQSQEFAPAWLGQHSRSKSAIGGPKVQLCALPVSFTVSAIINNHLHWIVQPLNPSPPLGPP